jgi:2'-5' RNA ligase
MADRQSDDPRARLFVALDLPGTVRAEIAAWGRRELSDPALRPVSPESLHITLAFLGQRPEREIERIAAVVGESVMPAPEIELLDPVGRPSRGRPKVFALPVRSPQAIELQALLEKNLIAAGLHEVQERPFWPHVTVARVRSQGGRARRPMVVSAHPGPLPTDLARSIRSVRTVFYRSELQPSGARYVPLAQVELPAGQQ